MIWDSLASNWHRVLRCLEESVAEQDVIVGFGRVSGIALIVMGPFQKSIFSFIRFICFIFSLMCKIKIQIIIE